MMGKDEQFLLEVNIGFLRGQQTVRPVMIGRPLGLPGALLLKIFNNLFPGCGENPQPGFSCISGILWI